MEREDHLFLVYFFYGLSFLVLGVLLLAQNVHRAQSTVADEGEPQTPARTLLENLWYLGMFATLHGLNEWVDMSLMSEVWVRLEGVMEIAASLLYAMSSLCLFEFGLSMLTVDRPRIQWVRWLPLVAFVFWLASMVACAVLQTPLPTLDARGWLRYALGLTGGLLTGFALLSQRTALIGGQGAAANRLTGVWGHDALAPRLRKLLIIAAIFFAINAFLSTVLAAESSVGMLISEGEAGQVHALLHRLGVTSPLTLFRALCALIICFSLVQALVTIDREQNRQIVTHQFDLETANESLRASYAKLREAQHQLVQSERMSAVGTLLTGIAHEFNNLLAGVKGYTQLARESEDITQVRADLGEIEQTTDRAVAILRTLLSWVRTEPRVSDRSDINEMTRLTVDLVRATHRNRLVDITLDLQPVPRLPVPKTDLQDVVMHLVLNAVQAVPEGREGHVTVGSRLRADGRVELIVRDDGAGIAVEHIDKVFLPFFTTKGAQGRSQTPGLGLGLYIVYGVVTRAGGEVMIASQPGTGTQVTVLVPAPPPDAVPDASDTQDVDTLLSRMRILVVEDERALREVMLTSLHTRALEARGVSSGREALEVMSATPYDLIFIDMLMPGISGIETMRQLRDIAPTTPVFIMSKNPDPATRGDMIERGASGLVHAPFSAAELVEVVRQAASRSLAQGVT